MIDTIVCKEQQLRDGFYHIGSGPTEVLVLGSCRTVPYVEYLCRSPELTVRRIDPCDWTLAGIDLVQFETDERILKVLESTDIFIHEWLENYGMFNTDIMAEKSIYRFTEATWEDITIPNFNDHMILEGDYAAYGAPTPDDYIERGWKEIDKFCGVCELSSFPEFAQTFRDTWTKVRYFWRPNHVSAHFTKAIFKLMNEKFLKLPIENVTDEDLFCSPCTQVSQRDREGYGIEW